MTQVSFNPETFKVNPKALEGQTVVITGTMAKLDRKQAEELVERAGGKATGSISGKTNLLVAGEKAGSKLQKAAQLDVEVLNEEGFLSRIAQQKEDEGLAEEITNEIPDNHPKDYVVWNDIYPINNDDLESWGQDRMDLTLKNLSEILFFSCQYYNEENLKSGILEYYFDSLDEKEKEEEIQQNEDTDNEGDIFVLESAIDIFIRDLNEEDKKALLGKLVKEDDDYVNPEALKGIKVLITGNMSKLYRRDIEKLIERAGGQLNNTISGKTSLIIKGEKAGIKTLQKSKELGIEVLSESEFLERIEYRTI